MTLLRRLGFRLSTEYAQFVMRKECCELLAELLLERDQEQDEIARMGLQHARLNRDLVSRFLIFMESPEEADEIREKLWGALSDFEDEIARREEHATS